MGVAASKAFELFEKGKGGLDDAGRIQHVAAVLDAFADPCSQVHEVVVGIGPGVLHCRCVPVSGDDMGRMQRRYHFEHLDPALGIGLRPIAQNALNIDDIAGEDDIFRFKPHEAVTGCVGHDA